MSQSETLLASHDPHKDEVVGGEPAKEGRALHILPGLLVFYLVSSGEL